MFAFFGGLERRGFRIFSRELNLAPVFEGRQPVACEFSLLNPRTYYSRGEGQRARVERQMALVRAPRTLAPRIERCVGHVSALTPLLPWHVLTSCAGLMRARARPRSTCRRPACAAAFTS